MKKSSFFAVALATMVFAACGGKKTTQNAEEVSAEISFEQEQIEASIKQNFDSLATQVGNLKQLPIRKKDGVITLSEEEMKVKPDYLLDPAVAENAVTLSEKYRMISALSVDKQIAALYDMPIDEYQKAIAKLVADINDPSFKEIQDANTIYETTQTLYDAMNQNGRINYFWQLAATSLVEELYVMTQNTDKFIASFDDEAASNVTYRIVLLIDAINRLTQYDSEIEPIAKAIAPLNVLNAISVDQLKSQLADAKEKIVSARSALIK